MKIIKEEIRENVIAIIGILSFLSMLAGFIFFLAPSIINDYYQIDKSKISHFNEVLYKVKTNITIIYQTQDSLESSINHQLNYKEVKDYGAFIKKAIKSENDEVFHLKENIEAVHLSPNLRKILLKFFSKPFPSYKSLVNEIDSKFKDIDNLEIEGNINDLFSKTQNNHFFLDSTKIRLVPKLLLI